MDNSVRFRAARRRFTALVFRLFRLMPTEQTIPFGFVVLARRLRGEELLTIGELKRAVVTGGKSLENPRLAKVLANETFSSWSLDVCTLNLLMRLARRSRASSIVEFGSGISTVCFAQTMKEMYGEDRKRVCVYSIEQNYEFALSTEGMLLRLGLNDYAKVFWAPVEAQMIEGARRDCYRMSTDLINELKSVRPDFLVVDGPAGKKGMRFGTLPLIKDSAASGARFFLDDALRDEELEISSMWRKLDYLDVDGVHILGKGLLAGKVRAERSNSL